MCNSGFQPSHGATIKPEGPEIRQYHNEHNADIIIKLEMSMGV